jgi:hypothetical protein
MSEIKRTCSMCEKEKPLDDFLVGINKKTKSQIYNKICNGCLGMKNKEENRESKRGTLTSIARRMHFKRKNI